MTIAASHRRDERGAAALEFALVGPVFFVLVFGLMYVLLVAAAHVSVAHAASVGARYAAIPIDPVHGVYPTSDEVSEKADAASPFVSRDACETAVTGDEAHNAPVSLDLTCDFPNPFGSAFNALIGRDDPSAGPFGDVVGLSASAQARRE